MYGSAKAADLPLSRRGRARLDRHAANQAKHRENLAEKKAPNREDFGRAALTVALVLYHADPGSDVPDAIRRAIVRELEHVGFDREQAVMRFDKMTERAAKDRQRWRVKREWVEEMKAAGN